MKADSAPTHLSKPAQAWFRGLQNEYAILDSAGVALLTVAAESWDRARSAREAIDDAGGPICQDRFGQDRAHPAVAVERDSRAQLLAALKQLNLDIEPLRDGPGRPATESGLPGGK